MSIKFVFITLLLCHSQLVTAVSASLDEVKNEALKQLNHKVNVLRKEYNTTLVDIQSMKERVHEIQNLITRQGGNIKENNIEELENDIRTQHFKAKILESKISVFICISNIGNNHQKIVSDYFKQIFIPGLQADTQTTKNKHDTEIDMWNKNMTTQEKSFTELFKNSCVEIMDSKDEACIIKIVAAVEKEAQAFLRNIKRITPIIIDDQKLFLDSQRSKIETLRAECHKNKDNSMKEMDGCFVKMLH